MSEDIPEDDARTARIREAAKRARAEAEERRAIQQDAQNSVWPKEHGGRDGPEPTRFGDWEKKGITSDF